MKLKKLTRMLLCILILVFMSGCGVKNISEGTLENITYKETEEVTNYVKIFVKNKGTILVELDPTEAPITVANFQKLVSEKFYDGIIFHRVAKDFVIQAGDPTGTGAGGSKETIQGEFKSNGVENTISHVRGVISMARTSNDMNSASSQFFITLQDATYLDGEYAGFGHVIAGMDVVDKIGSVETTNEKPNTNIFIESIRFVEIEK